MIRAGQILKEKRLEKKISLEDVSKATKIKIHFLKSIEENDYNALPSSSYAQGFVRNYAQYLGFSERQIMPIFRREFDSEKSFAVLPKGLGAKEDFPLQKMKIGRTLILIAGIFFLVLGYILFQYRYAFVNPPLSVSSPKEGATITASEIEVIGKTDPNSTVFVNNNAVALDQSGNFKKSIDVFQGPTTIKISSTNKAGRETQIQRHITVQSQ